MLLQLQKSVVFPDKSIAISGSKSETNRLLLLKALFPQIEIGNSSVSDDSRMMEKALASSSKTIDVHHAGTAMRFLTAYFSFLEGSEVVLTGSSRMKERPIGILVDALRKLGAHIDYLENEGFPPLKISGQKPVTNQVTLKADVSSQFISALLLMGPKLENGIELTLEGEITSIPYIKMTLSLLNAIGIKTHFTGNKITVASGTAGMPEAQIVNPKSITVESDWSSASYFYSIIALSEPGTKIKLSSYRQNSLQGDAALAEIYKGFGVTTVFKGDTLILNKDNRQSSVITCHLNNTPDLAQTIAVTAFGLGMSCRLTGLHTLKIKETDRLEALKSELLKLGAHVSVSNESLILEPSFTILPNIRIATYNDHRMAMAFAPLALKIPIAIENPEVVSKSYPGFWKDLALIGFKMEGIE